MVAAKRRGYYRWFMLPFMMVAVNFKARAQNNCPTPDSVFHPEILTSSIGGMTANLSVECNQDEVKLYLSSGGILVRNVKVFKECVLRRESEMGDSADTTLILYDPSTGNSPHQEQWTSSPPNQVLVDDVVCSYHGCYEAKRYEYELNYYLTFTAESKCTFAQRIQASSPIMSPQSTVYQESSMNAASPSHHTQIQHTVSTTMPGMQPSFSVSQLQPTTFPGVQEKITSIDSSDTPLPPTQETPSPILELQPHNPTSVVSISTHYSTMVVGFPSHSGTPTTSNVFQWTVITILIPVVLAMLLVISICFIKRKASIITRRWKRQYSEKNEWTTFSHDEPIIDSFFPVDIDLPALPISSTSLQSIRTKLDPMEYCSPVQSGTPMEDTLQVATLPTTCSLLNIAHSDSDAESNKLSMESDSQSLHTPGHDPNELSMRGFFSVRSLDPRCSAYNYSLESSEYIQLQRWYNGTYGSKSPTAPATTAILIISTDGEIVSSQSAEVS